MSLTPDSSANPNARPAGSSRPLTPGTIATQFSKMDFPAPTGLRLNLSKSPTSPSPSPGAGAAPDSALSAGSNDTGDLSGPEPEAIVEARRRFRSESMSEQLSATLATMNLPQPERIFGPNEGESPAAREGDKGVSAEDWDKIKLEDDIPEAVKEPVRMTHSRNASKAELARVRSPLIPEEKHLVPEHHAAKEQRITPFDVEGAVNEEGKDLGIDYDKLVARFGAQKISQDLLDRFEKLTGHRPHPLLRRGTFFSHRDFNIILDRYEKGQPFYLYTGRGPSSNSMHMGHLIPFMFTAWLQRVFNVPLVIQITDDEKYLLQRDVKKQADMMKKIKGKKPLDLLRHYKHMAQDNIKDIIACGFILEKTYIFQDLSAMGGAFYDNVVLMSKTLTASNIKGVFGFTDSDNVGMFHFASIQATPSFSNSFPQIFGQRDDIPALIPCAIDQDPYFLLARDSADKLGYKKPCLLHSKFLPALQGSNTKMSASNENSAVFMTDDAKKIHKKIRSHAFSGGGATQEDHRANGGNPDIDVAYQFLSFFEDDDEKMRRLAEEYRAGTLSTVQMKDECIAKLQEVVAGFQKRRSEVTDEMVQQFQDPTRKIDPRPAKKAEAAAAATVAA